jgi:sugar O-acyltransferase (sialic acid O-acetyltransferase NeuD family)
MGTNLVVFGNGVAANVFREYIREDSRYSIACNVVEEGFEEPGAPSSSIPLKDVASLHPPSSHRAIVLVGYAGQNEPRERLFEVGKALGYEFETYIHPRACVSASVDLGEGSVVMAGSVVEPFSRIGSNSVVWSNCVIGHNSAVGDHCWVSSGAVMAGNSAIGSRSFIGVGAIISNGVIVGNDNMLGAGAFISKKTDADSVMLARSAEKIRFTARQYSNFDWGSRE